MIGQYKWDVSVVPYHSGWKDQFEQEAELLRNELGENALKIEHVGSTAIPGMDAKPRIDIMVAVPSLSKAKELIPRLESLGYLYRAHDAIPERMFFAKESSPNYRTHHLSLAELNSDYWKNQLAFRDYLRLHRKIAAEYAELKKHIAEVRGPSNRVKLDDKYEFVAKVLDLAKKERKRGGKPPPNVHDFIDKNQTKSGSR